MHSPLWMGGAFAALARSIESLPPSLASRFSRVAARIGSANGETSLAAALASPAATPGIALFDAYRHDLGFDDADPRLATLGEAMLALYFHVRIQDDLVDEPALFDPAFVYLAETFSSRSAAAFARALDSIASTAAFFAFRERVLTRFAATATWEIDSLHAGRAALSDEARIGEKLLPLVIPLGALSFLALREAEADALVDVLVPLATGLQITNDLLNLCDDHAGRRPTPLLFRLYREGAITEASPVADVRTALLGGDVIEEACRWASGEIERARSIASGLGRTRLASTIVEKARFLEGVPRIVTATCLQVAA